MPRKTLNQRAEEIGRTLSLNGVSWQRLRIHILSLEPLCRYCNLRGCITPATEIDHIDNDPSNNETANLQPLCKSCHSKKTASDYGKRVQLGCDANGMPINANHLWNVQKITSNRTPRTDLTPSI